MKRVLFKGLALATRGITKVIDVLANWLNPLDQHLAVCSECLQPKSWHRLKDWDEKKIVLMSPTSDIGKIWYGQHRRWQDSRPDVFSSRF